MGTARKYSDAQLDEVRRLLALRDPGHRHGKPTIDEIADQTGVHRSVVSLVNTTGYQRVEPADGTARRPGPDVDDPNHMYFKQFAFAAARHTQRREEYA